MAIWRRRLRDLDQPAFVRLIATARFQARLRKRLAAAPPRSLEDVRTAANGVLRDLGVNPARALLTFSWDPDAGDLGVFVRPAAAVSAREQ